MLRRALLRAAETVHAPGSATPSPARRAGKRTGHRAAGAGGLRRDRGRGDFAAGTSASKNRALLALAVFFGRTRLIDNLVASAPVIFMQSYDFIIIGSGVAGLTFALKAAAHGRVAIITKRAPADSNTAWAQGGVACVWSSEDSLELHVAGHARSRRGAVRRGGGAHHRQRGTRAHPRTDRAGRPFRRTRDPARQRRAPNSTSPARAGIPSGACSIRRTPRAARSSAPCSRAVGGEPEHRGARAPHGRRPHHQRQARLCHGKPLPRASTCSTRTPARWKPSARCA